ncbi:MAG TPA: hypothetical protein IGS53_01525 [Leptolyngbyaceae cyanobacterium M33_DOE_097]|uniref:Uncharacterized protein n=1 Tax=Oscillatoriales cyanobacterium SpSt-418 TaxID=2282169 RepID=A0A7C3PPU0_9CYAN|nr:hypothetical protein [Leptolyngbyaceae cyanobacterium M33_DOE_097]
MNVVHSIYNQQKRRPRRYSSFWVSVLAGSVLLHLFALIAFQRYWLNFLKVQVSSASAPVEITFVDKAQSTASRRGASVSAGRNRSRQPLGNRQGNRQSGSVARSTPRSRPAAKPVITAPAQVTTPIERQDSTPPPERVQPKPKPTPTPAPVQSPEATIDDGSLSQAPPIDPPEVETPLPPSNNTPQPEPPISPEPVAPEESGEPTDVTSEPILPPPNEETGDSGSEIGDRPGQGNGSPSGGSDEGSGPDLPPIGGSEAQVSLIGTTQVKDVKAQPAQPIDDVKVVKISYPANLRNSPGLKLRAELLIDTKGKVIQVVSAELSSPAGEATAQETATDIANQIFRTWDFKPARDGLEGDPNPKVVLSTLLVEAQISL